MFEMLMDLNLKRQLFIGNIALTELGVVGYDAWIYLDHASYVGRQITPVEVDF